MKNRFAFLLLTAVSLCFSEALPVEVDYSSANGKDQAVVFAAKDLKRILKNVSGRIELCEDPAMSAQEWAFETRSEGVVAISGRDGMGIAYGVYDFLEKYAGVRWFAPDTEFIPDLSNWKMPVLNRKEVYAPKYSYREMYTGEDVMDPVWRLRNKESHRAAFGVGCGTGSPKDNHTFDDYVKILRKNHPELFKSRPSARGVNCMDLCMTDDTTRRLVAEEICRNIASDRKRREGRERYRIPTLYDLSQPDGPSGYECMCGECRKLFNEAGGTYAGPNIAFVSDVAARVAERYPDVTIQTFAYGYTSTPPTNGMKAAHNVNVRYCNAWIFDPLLKGTPQGDTLEAWAKCADQFGIWSYWRTYHGELFPFVKKRAEIAGEIGFCASLGATRYFAENERPLARSFAMMQHWIFLKMTEDPSRDVFALSREFIRGYYRSAADPIERYLNYLESRQYSGVGCVGEPQKRHLDREFFEKVNGYLDEAEKLAKDDPVALRPVHWERVVVDRSTYDVLCDLRKQGYRFDGNLISRRFLDYSREQLENWPALQYPKNAAIKASRMARVENEARLYAHYPLPLPKEFDGLEVSTVEWMQLRGIGSKIVEDPDAAAGTAFYNPKFDFKLPFTMGVYHHELKSGESIHFMTMDDVPQDEKFHIYRIGRQLIKAPLKFYFDGAWHCVQYMPTLGIVPEYRDIWISMKFQGPQFVKGSTKPDRVLYDRVFYVKNDDPMRGYEKIGENLVPPEKRKMTVSSPDASYKAVWVNLGDPAKMDHSLYIRGVCSWKNVRSPSRLEKRPYPFVGIWAVTKKDGRNDFTRPCQTFFVGDYENQRFETVVDAERLRRLAHKAGEPLELTFRINLYNQPSTVTVSDLEIVPVQRKR